MQYVIGRKGGKKSILRGAALHPFVSVRVAFAVFAVGLPSLTGGSNQRYTVPFFFLMRETHLFNAPFFFSPLLCIL